MKHFSGLCNGYLITGAKVQSEWKAKRRTIPLPLLMLGVLARRRKALHIAMANGLGREGQTVVMDQLMFTVVVSTFSLQCKLSSLGEYSS